MTNDNSVERVQIIKRWASADAARVELLTYVVSFDFIPL